MTFCICVDTHHSFFVGRAGLLAHNMEIQIKTITGKIYKINCKNSDTIEVIKVKLCDAEKKFLGFDLAAPKEGDGRITCDTIRLIYAGKQLEDGRTLSDYNIQEGGCIHYVARIRGGGTGKESSSWSSSSHGFGAGGTTLQGESDVKYGSAKHIDMDYENIVKLKLRLVAQANSAEGDEIPVVRDEKCTALQDANHGDAHMGEADAGDADAETSENVQMEEESFEFVSGDSL